MELLPTNGELLIVPGAATTGDPSQESPLVYMPMFVGEIEVDSPSSMLLVIGMAG